MEDSKGLFRSVTFWSVVASVIFRVLQAYGYAPEVAGQWEKLVLEFGPLAAGLIADGFALFGRMRAQTKLLVTKPTAPVAPINPAPEPTETGVT